jgi:hypothetical protein
LHQWHQFQITQQITQQITIFKIKKNDKSRNPGLNRFKFGNRFNNNGRKTSRSRDGLTKGTLTIGNLTSTTASYTATFPTALSTANYLVCATIISLGNGQADNEVQFAIGAKTVNGFTLYIRETANVTQNINLEYIIFPQ